MPIFKFIQSFIIGLSVIICFTIVACSKTSEQRVATPKVEHPVAPTKEKDTKTTNLANEKPKPDSSTKSSKPIRVLLTGDSMIGCLFFPLRKLNKEKKYKFIYSPWYGSTSKDWAMSDTLEKLLTKYKPDYVFFTIGANELLYYKITSRKKYYDTIITQLKDHKYIFVGAPNWKPASDYYTMLKELVPTEQLFDSENMILKRRKDGAHPTYEAGFEWTDSLNLWLGTHSAYRDELYVQ